MSGLAGTDSLAPDTSSTYDIVIVGGGSHGGALAWQASLRGYKVLLLEREDFVCATSSNSMKIIHGGVRYLQRLDIVRLRLSVFERTKLLSIAPHLVFPLKCVIPTYKKLSKNKWVVGAAFRLYDLLSAGRNRGISECKQIPDTRTLSKYELKQAFPGIKDNGFTGGAVWYDATVRSAERLVLSYLFSAQELGANILNYTAVTDILTEAGQVVGVVAIDKFSQKEVRVKCGLVVDATGPWSFFRQYCDQARKKWYFTKAVNIIVNRRLVDDAIGLTVPASKNAVSRMLFLAPTENATAIGTWYFHCEGGTVAANDVTQNEITLILQDINSVLSGVVLTLNDVSRVQVGLLPIKSGEAPVGDPDLISDSEIEMADKYGGPGGLVYIQGTKLTTALSSSIRCLDVINANTKGRFAKAIHSEKLFDWQTTDKYGEFLSGCEVKYKHLWSADTVREIIGCLGTKIKRVAAIAEANMELQGVVPGGANISLALVAYIIENQRVFTLSDLLLRRLNVGAYSVPAMETVECCADMLARHSGWSQAVRAENIRDLLETYPSWTKEK
ncbi:MAG: FAD-dependent oxidoreductase [Gammaproteobacteria bacterium]|nr:FAD-dependent oxidoreductase [Gammaproteobacteria bacterium]